jgi:hypothetical protein
MPAGLTRTAVCLLASAAFLPASWRPTRAAVSNICVTLVVGRLCGVAQLGLVEEGDY